MYITPPKVGKGCSISRTSLAGNSCQEPLSSRAPGGEAGKRPDRAWRLCGGAAGEVEEGTGQQARLQRRRASRERHWDSGEGQGEDEQRFLINFIIIVINTTTWVKNFFFVEKVFREGGRRKREDIWEHMYMYN